jgi:hypothetical protein
VATALSLVAMLGSRYRRPSGVEIAVDLVVALSFAVTGLIAWERRPENNTGRLLLAVSFTWSLGLLGTANDAFVSTIGLAGQSLVLAAFVHLVLAYPTGRLLTRADRLIVASGYALAVVANLLTLMFEPHPACSKCATNVFFVADRPGAGRWKPPRTSPPQRSSPPSWRSSRRGTATGAAHVQPIGLTGAALACGGLSLPARSTRAPDVRHDRPDHADDIPFWFLAGPEPLRPMRRAPCSTCARPRARGGQDGLRRALNDPGVMLAAWVEERHGYVDPNGRAFEVPTEDVERIATMVASETGEPVAVIVHDRALLDEPELLEAVAVAARLALHRNRLQAELRARLDELQRERDFMRDAKRGAGLLLRRDPRAASSFNDTMMRATGVIDEESTRGRLSGRSRRARGRRASASA